MGMLWSWLALGSRSRGTRLRLAAWLGGEAGSINVLYALALDSDDRRAWAGDRYGARLPA